MLSRAPVGEAPREGGLMGSCVRPQPPALAPRPRLYREQPLAPPVPSDPRPNSDLLAPAPLPSLPQAFFTDTDT